MSALLRHQSTRQGAVISLRMSLQHFTHQNRLDSACTCNFHIFVQLLIAAGLLDCTIKVLYDDSLKFFLSLYGHKLPVLALDMSYDGRLLVSGSADKTVKIWGLDFGDCHRFVRRLKNVCCTHYRVDEMCFLMCYDVFSCCRSLIAHEDSVTAVRFQPNTHYFFTGGKDGNIKYWDADR